MRRLCAQDAAIVRHLLWKLFHIEDALASRADAIETKNAELDPLRSAHAESEKSLKSAKKDLAAAQKASSKAERTLQRREKDVEELKPGLVEVEEKTKHAKGKKEKAEKVKKDVERDRKKKDEEVKKLKAEKTMVEQAERQFQGASSSSMGSKCGLLIQGFVGDYRKTAQGVAGYGVDVE